MIAGGLKCPVEKDLRSDIWLKLLGNVAFNPVSVLTRATMGEIARHPGTRQLVLNMMYETAEIAARLGSPPKLSVERRFDGAAKVGDHKTSMLMDFEAGKLLETDVLLKAPIELARLVEVAAPSLEMVYALIDLMTVNAAPQYGQYLDTAPDKRLAVRVARGKHAGLLPRQVSTGCRATGVPRS
jgi:2-dehydropantoate 2-reductase